MLDINSARMIAETLWGRGETVSQRCNHAGAWWFSCAEHGGMVLDISKLTDDQREEITSFGKTMKGHVLNEQGEPRRAGIGAPGIKRKDWDRQDVEFMIFEQDRDWCVPLTVLGIGKFSQVTDMVAISESQNLFRKYFDPMNPEVMARRKVDYAIENGDPDIIVAAVRTSSDECKAWTADGKRWIVEGYEDSLGQGGAHYLSLCSNMHEITGTRRGNDRAPAQESETPSI